MSNRTIAKFWAFVILAAAASSVASCGHASSQKRRGPEFDTSASGWEKPAIIGEIKSPEITESSGLAASRCQPNVLWTHNDSGDGPYIYAIDPSGANLGTFKVQNAENEDWEDIAGFKDTDGRCYLFIGEIGNTEKLERTQHKIYRINEPLVGGTNADLSRKTAVPTQPAEVLSFRYPDRAHDAETLMVHPQSGDLYVLTKHRSDLASVFKIKADFANFQAAVAIAQKIGELTVPAIPHGMLTGGAISPDGTRVVLCDYSAAYELISPTGLTNFDDIWSQKPLPIDLGSRKQGEAITYSADGTSIFATSEKRGSPVIEVKRR